MKYSASKLQSFLSCKLSFYHKYIIKDMPYISTPFAELGTAIHTVLEHYRLQPLMSNNDLKAVFRKNFRPPDDFGWLTPQGYKMIDNFRKDQIFLGKLVATEWRFNVEINENVTLNGIIDKIEDVDGTLVVTDYKTNKVAAPDEYYQQLAIYDIAVKKKYPGNQPVRNELLYMRHNKSFPISFNEEFHDKMVGAIEGVGTFITENEDNITNWPKLTKKGKCCGWCPLVKKCFGKK